MNCSSFSLSAQDRYALRRRSCRLAITVCRILDIASAARLAGITATILLLVPHSFLWGGEQAGNPFEPAKQSFGDICTKTQAFLSLRQFGRRIDRGTNS